MSNEPHNPEQSTRSPWLPCMASPSTPAEEGRASSLTSSLTNALFVALHTRDPARQSMSGLLPSCLGVVTTFPGA